MKKVQDTPLVLTSPESINDGGRKYNWIYLVCAGIFLILFIGIGANWAGVFLGVLIGLCVGWLVKNKILDISSLQLRFIEFEVKNKIPYPALIAELIPRLTPLGMTIEKSDEQNGHPVISYQKMIYDISYSDDGNTFTIWWRKNIARALFTVDSIKTYRKIVVAMGIIGYYVQQSCNSEVPGESSQTERQGEAPSWGQDNADDGIFSKIWNHPAFTTIAVKFGNILDILLGIVGIFLALVMFSGEGFFSTVLRIIFLICGIGIVFSDIRSLLSRKREPETEEDLNRKKRNLCIGAAIIIIGLLVVTSTGGVYSDVKSIAFDNMGPETIGELVEANVKGAEWSKEKVADDSWLVSVEGYCPLYSEDIKIEFFYEKLDDGYREVTLQSVEFPESGEYYNDAFSAGMVWASFYE